MSASQSVVYVAATVQAAHLLKNVLRAEGIVAHVTNEALQFGLGELPYGAATAPRVVVAERDAEQARRIAVDFDQTTRRGLPGVERTRGPFQFGLRAMFYVTTCSAVYFAVDTATAGSPANGIADALVLNASIFLGAYLVYRRKRTEWDKVEGQPTAELAELEQQYDQSRSEWPRCPGCNRRRHTSCPVCKTAGSEFPDAFAASADQTQLFVLCPTCDEPFEPVFLARCEWCGHDFGDGVAIRTIAPWSSPFAEMNGRAWIVLAGLVAFFAALVGLVLATVPRS